MGFFFSFLDEYPNGKCISSALISVAEETTGWAAAVSVAVGALVALASLVLLLLFLQSRRRARDFTPLLETQLSSKSYTEEA